MLIKTKFCGYQRDGLRRYGFDFGDTPDPPDYAPMAAASERSAELGHELGTAQLAENVRQYDANMEIARPIVDAQGRLMQQSYDQGGENYAAFKAEGRPLQQAMRDDALGITTPEKRRQMDEAARMALTGVSEQLDSQREQTTRAMTRMGVNPNSGRFAAIQGGLDVGAAGVKANAANSARVGAGDRYYAKLGDTYNTYAGLGSSAPTFYAAGTSAGNSATGNQNQTAAQFINGMNAGTGTIMQGQGQKISGLGSILSSQTSVYNTGQESSGDLLGTALGVGAKLWMSDRRLKDDIELVGQDERTGLNLYSFHYTNDPDPTRHYIGVMADEVEKVDPEAVTYSAYGFAQVDYRRLGIQMREVA